MGDLRSLAESMTEVGLLHPIVVTEGLRLIAGCRRLAAARLLGWLEVPVTVIASITEADVILRAEDDENLCRKDFTPTEARELKQAREALLIPMARGRQGTRTDLADATTSAQVEQKSARTDRVAAQGTGYSASTIRKVERVTAISEDQSAPEHVREAAKAALVEMDATGKVDGPHRTATQAARAGTSLPTPMLTLQAIDDLHAATKAVRKARRSVGKLIESGLGAYPDRGAAPVVAAAAELALAYLQVFDLLWDEHGAPRSTA
jgi:ParB family chromosome partitioning protein